MAKKKSRPDVVDAVVSSADEEVFDAVDSASFEELSDRVTALEAALEKAMKLASVNQTPVRVTQIDLNDSFKTCLHMALDSMFKSSNVQNMLEVPTRAEHAIAQAVQIAEMLQAKLCERFAAP